MAKPCITCARPFHLDAFYVNRRRTRQDGTWVVIYEARCKVCYREYVRSRKEANREAQRRYRAAHPDRDRYFSQRKRQDARRKALAAKLVTLGVLYVQEEG